MDMSSLWPLGVYLLVIFALVAAILVVSAVAGGRSSGRARDEPFESGVVTVGFARLRFSAKFYLVAMFFIIFDLEAVYLFAWGVAFREVGWSGYAEALIFMIILFAALLYLWRLGALDWAPSRDRHRRPGEPG